MSIVVVYNYAEPGISPDVFGPFDSENIAEKWAITKQKHHPGIFNITEMESPSVLDCDDSNLYREPISGKLYMDVGDNTVRLTRGLVVDKWSVVIAIRDGRSEGIGWELV